MPVKPIDITEIDGIEYLVKLTFDYLNHPDVADTVPGAQITKLKLNTVWGLVWTHLQQHPTRPVPSRALAAKLSFAAQEAADLLDSPKIRAIPFAIRSTNVARSLRDLVKRLKDFRK